MAIQNDRQLLNKKEKQYNTYMVNTVYPTFGISAATITDRDEQISGIDVRFTYNDTEYNCDEKYQLYWLNNTKTSIELEIENQGGRRENGWYYSTGSDSINFIYFKNSTMPEHTKLDHPITYNDIDEIESVVVKKEALQRYFMYNGFRDDKIDIYKKMLDEQLSKYPNQKVPYIWLNKFNRVKINYISSKPEKPYNIQVEREELEKIADFVLRYKIRH